MLNIKKAGILRSITFGLCLIGQVAYAQAEISYTRRLPSTG